MQTGIERRQRDHLLDLCLELEDPFLASLPLPLIFLFRSLQSRLILLYSRFPLGVCDRRLLVQSRYLLFMLEQLVVCHNQPFLRIHGAR